MSGASLICASLAASRKRVAEATKASCAGGEPAAALPCASLPAESPCQHVCMGKRRRAWHAQAVDEGQRVLRVVQRRQRLRQRRAAARRGARQRLLRALQRRRQLLLLRRRAAAQRVDGSHLEFCGSGGVRRQARCLSAAAAAGDERRTRASSGSAMAAAGAGARKLRRIHASRADMRSGGGGNMGTGDVLSERS